MTRGGAEGLAASSDRARVSEFVPGEEVAELVTGVLGSRISDGMEA